MSDPEYRLGLEIGGRIRLSQYGGTGQFSHFYEAEILSIGRAVGRCAVKIYQLKPTALRNEVMEEFQAAMGLKHPGLVALQGFGELEGEDRTLYLTTEYTSNNLRRHLSRTRQMPEDEVRLLARAIAEALEYLHIHRRFHGELRPSTVVLSGDIWKLADFELARTKMQLVRLEPASDTLHYSPPEQVLGKPGLASDIWSLACILHEALTGHHPFGHLAGASPSELAYRAEQEGPHLDGKLSDPWKLLFHSCLQHEPAQRWNERHLLDWLDGRAPEPPVPLPPEPEPAYERERVVLPAEPIEMEIKRSTRPRVQPVEPEPVPEPPPPPPPRPRRARSSVWLGVSVIMLLFAVTVCVLIVKGPSIDPLGTPTPLTLYPMPFEAPEVDNTGRVVKSEAGEAQGYAEAVSGAEPIEMVSLAGGAFNMGVPELEPEAEPEEGPPHTVKLSPFFISRREITQEQWKAVSHLPQVKTPMVEEPSESRGDQLPVDSVSWEDCQEFCRRLSRLSKRRYRLPTEAEWEYAARAGTSTPFCFGPTISPEVAIYNATQAYGESPVVTEPRLSAANVGETGAANKFGLFDVHGNVEEWCQDWYGPYNPKTAVNPTGPESGTERVLRGGGWYSYAWNCRSAARAHARPEQGSNYTGFRIVCESDEKQ